MAKFSPQEIHIPEDGQTVITVSHPYVMGTNELKVYLNGIISANGIDYTETTNLTLTFNFQLSSEDIVITEHMVYFEDKMVKVISEKGSALYGKYGEEERLKPNQQYTLEFMHGVQLLKSSFVTVFNPMYSTIPIVRNEYPDFFANIPDATIAIQIYMNSVLVDNLILDADGVIAVELTPFQQKQFVRYQTQLDLALGIYFAISGKPSSDHKILGAFEVEKRWRLEDISFLLRELKTKLKPWDDIVKGRRAVSPLRTAVRGGSNFAYPLTTPRRGSV